MDATKLALLSVTAARIAMESARLLRDFKKLAEGGDTPELDAALATLVKEGDDLHAQAVAKLRGDAIS